MWGLSLGPWLSVHSCFRAGRQGFRSWLMWGTETGLGSELLATGG